MNLSILRFYNIQTKIMSNLHESIVNRGTGAGGKNTNFYGKKFEEKTNNEPRLVVLGFNKEILKESEKKCNLKNNYAFIKEFEDRKITYTPQNCFKKYMNIKYNIKTIRLPDEAYIIEYSSGIKKIKILEKKEQNVEGSIETKLWSSNSLKREYELLLGNNFVVEYNLCVNSFLEKKIKSTELKYVLLNRILKESNIDILYGDSDDYLEYLDKWIYEDLFKNNHKDKEIVYNEKNMK